MAYEYSGVAKEKYPDHKLVGGYGPVALIADCECGKTISLHECPEEAFSMKVWIDLKGCVPGGEGCTRAHRVDILGYDYPRSKSFEYKKQRDI
jgi:hypothetical protein